MSNFGVALPQVEELDEQDMADLFPTKMHFPVTSRHGRVPLANLPAYMVARESLACMLEEQKLFPGEKKLQIKILGFEKAQKTSEEAMMLKGSTPAVMPPPALLMHDLFIEWRFVIPMESGRRRMGSFATARTVFFDLLKKMMVTDPEKRITDPEKRISMQEAMEQYVLSGMSIGWDDDKKY
ncbi:hypothetical protein MY10362_004581 [Beauveria mimosiformis]